jgi:hypothetical protein
MLPGLVWIVRIPDWQYAEHVVIHVQQLTDRPKIRSARSHFRLISRSAERGDKDGDEDSDDCNDDEEFDESERRNAALRNAARPRGRFPPHDKPLFSGDGCFGDGKGEAPGLNEKKK